jgi:hypothetical protein
MFVFKKERTLCDNGKLSLLTMIGEIEFKEGYSQLA